MRCLFVLSVLLFGCSFESAENKSSSIDTDPATDNSYYSAGGDIGNDCPPPVKYIVMLDGKPTEQIYIVPCLAAKTVGDYTSDPSGWGNDNYDDNNYNGEYLPDLKPPAPGDPIPH